MLAIGRALMADPEYLLLDEPSLGLAPKIVEQIRDLIVSINQPGTGPAHRAERRDGALDRRPRLRHGERPHRHGRPRRDPPHDEDIQEFYLGGGGEQRSFRDVKHYKRRKRWLS
jgi:branched-chain amino acid transport system ATP-binding protein